MATTPSTPTGDTIINVNREVSQTRTSGPDLKNAEKAASDIKRLSEALLGFDRNLVKAYQDTNKSSDVLKKLSDTSEELSTKMRTADQEVRKALSAIGIEFGDIVNISSELSNTLPIKALAQFAEFSEKSGIINEARLKQMSEEMDILSKMLEGGDEYDKLLFKEYKIKQDLVQSGSKTNALFLKMSHSLGGLGGLVSTPAKKQSEAFMNIATSVFGPSSPLLASISKFAGAAGIWMMVFQELGKLIGSNAKDTLRYASMTGDYSKDQFSIQEQMLKVTAKTQWAGLKTKDVEEGLAKARDIYFQRLRGARPESILSDSADQMVAIASSASLFGRDLTTAIGEAGELATLYNTSLQQVGSSYNDLTMTFAANGIQIKDMNTLMLDMGSAARISGYSMYKAASQTLLLNKSLKDYGALAPRLLTSLTKFAGEISSEAFLAYENKPVGQNIGASMMRAAGTGPVDKMIAMMSRLMPEAQRGGSNPDEIAGRFMLMSGLDKLGPLGPILSRVLTKMDPDNLAKLSGISDKEEQFKFITSQASKADQDRIAALGGTMRRFENPMDFIIELLTSMLKAVGKILIAIPFAGGDAVERQKIDQGITDMLTGNQGRTPTQSKLRR